MNELPPDVQARLRALVAQGLPKRAIARALRVSRTTIRRYANAPIIGYDSDGAPVYGPPT